MVLMLVLVLLLLFGNIEVGVLAQQKHTGRRAVVRIEVGKLSAVRARRRSSAIIQLVVNGQSVDLLRCQRKLPVIPPAPPSAAHASVAAAATAAAICLILLLFFVVVLVMVAVVGLSLQLLSASVAVCVCCLL